jgi:hypothetical protein
MHHDRLVAWIKDTDVPATRRRLYFTMLGICGRPEDVHMLEDLMKSSDRKDKSGLDALLACYLMLTGEKGLPVVDELFLENDKAEYADTYSAIMAIRFHGSESNLIKKDRLVLSLRHILDRPNLADLVIPDLARWEDWDVMPRLVELFKTADEKSSWVRVPVINYLRACPLPEAQEHIAELRKIDPESVKRAMTFFPFGTDGKKEEPKDKPPADAAAARTAPAPFDATSFSQPLPPPDSEPAETDTLVVKSSDAFGSKIESQVAEREAEAELTSFAQPVSSEIVAAASSTRKLAATHASNPEGLVPNPASHLDDTGKQVAAAKIQTVAMPGTNLVLPNPLFVFGVPLVAGILLYFVFRSILGLPVWAQSNR